MFTQQNKKREQLQKGIENERFNSCIDNINDDNRCPTHCEHDILIVQYVDPEKVSDEDKEKLDKLGFFVCYEFDPRGCYASYRFGSG